jgi:ribosome-binding factor A
MKGDRGKRVADLVRSVLAEKLLRGAKDERLRWVTITRIDMAPDLKKAKVYVSFLPCVDDEEEILEVLNRAKGYLRRAVGNELKLKYTPELEFLRDREEDEKSRLQELFDKIRDDVVEEE